jgi:hypothetical protein
MSKSSPDAAERDYRAGVLTLREIGSLHGVSHTAIRKRAIRGGWTRDLLARVRSRAAQKIAIAMRGEQAQGFPAEVSKEVELLDAQVVESHAEAIVSVKLAQNARARQLGMLYDALLEELEASFTGECAIDLVERIGRLKSLTEVLSKVVALERQAYRLDELDEVDARARTSLPIRFIDPPKFDDPD